MINKLHVVAAIAILGLSAPAFADPVKVVAAENFYGDVASQIGGANVAVTSILTNPDQDPHLFEASTDTAKAMSDAKIVIVNGVDYDPWMAKLLSAHKAPDRKEIIVARLVGRKAGDNPHLWYEPAYVKAAAKALVADLIAVDPGAQGGLRAGRGRVPRFAEAARRQDRRHAQALRRQPVTASEPVFGYQAALIGLKVRNEKYRARGHEQRRADAFRGGGVRERPQGQESEGDAVQRAGERARGRASSCSSPRTTGFRSSASPRPSRRTSTYQAWMLGQLDALDRRSPAGRN